MRANCQHADTVKIYCCVVFQEKNEKQMKLLLNDVISFLGSERQEK